MNWLALLKSNGGHIAWSGIVIVMVTGAWLSQGERINDLSLEVGELRASVHYLEDALNECAE